MSDEHPTRIRIDGEQPKEATYPQVARIEQKMIDAMVSSSDGVAVAASAGKFPEGGPTRYQAAFETAARS
jgi:hypothetical protein